MIRDRVLFVLLVALTVLVVAFTGAEVPTGHDWRYLECDITTGETAADTPVLFAIPPDHILPHGLTVETTHGIITAVYPWFFSAS